MRVLVFPGSEVVGGSEISAIDLAAGLRDRGHDVLVYAKAGPLSELAAAKQLPVITASYPLRRRPSPRAAAELRRVVARVRPDVVHAYEGYSCTESLYGSGLRRRPVLLGTIYTMFVDTYVPRSIPLVVGTEQMREHQARTRAQAVFRLHPPVDAAHPASDDDGRAFRRSWDVDDDAFLAVMAARLDLDMKYDGLSSAVQAVSALAHDDPGALHLVIAGSGPARAALEELADRLAPPGRRTVTFTGHLPDPGPAYAAADVVLGMGTSVLRGMAAGKPSILVGERSHVQLVEPATVPLYLHQGFWAVGPGEGGASLLTDALRRVRDLGTGGRQELGRFGQQLVRDAFDLQGAVLHLEEVYRTALESRVARRDRVTDMVRTAPRVVAFKVRHRIRKLSSARGAGSPARRA